MRNQLIALVVIALAAINSQALAEDDQCAAAKAATAAQSRPADDVARDPSRKPAEVLCFFGITSGMHVLDLFSGSGYYTEILSALVGPTGEVTAHNNAAYLDFAKDQIEARYKDDRLPNVIFLHAEANDVKPRPGQFDAALMILAYHDIYYVTEDGSWPAIDGSGLLARILSGLKPGGVLGVVDHVATEGAPTSVGTSLHRIDPARLKREIEAAGYIFDGESKALSNPADDHALPMYDPVIRGRTDRIVYRFRKPHG